jgi:predicted DNA-binding transcriptional regulator YafY
MSRSARLLSLLQALRGRRRPVTAAELARSLEVSERTIYRDVAELAAQGLQSRAKVESVIFSDPAFSCRH